VEYIENMTPLTEISYTLNNVISGGQGRRFVFIDSITTMIIYNPPLVFAKFVHNLLMRMRIANVNGFLVSLETETSRDIRAEIGQLCDKVIRL